MTAVRPGFALTLAIHPNSKGFGWIAFEGASAPYDWGTIRVREGEPKNATCIRRAEWLFERLKPTALVLEAADATASKRSPRIKKLTHALAELSEGLGVPVAMYPLSDVQAVFAVVEAATRQEIAEAVARQHPILRPRLPKRRRAWEAENERLAIFSAAALVVTHDRLPAGALQ